MTTKDVFINNHGDYLYQQMILKDFTLRDLSVATGYSVEGIRLAIKGLGGHRCVKAICKALGIDITVLFKVKFTECCGGDCNGSVHEE